jgi:hypothetical protein
MKKPTVYLAGPMTGKPYYNFLQFDAYKARLTIKGLNVVSPADIDRKYGFDPLKSMTKNLPNREDCIQRDVQAICGVDAVCLMPGWKRSKGSLVEVAAAVFLDKPCYELKNLDRIDK